jgi:hypothetical protein
VLFSLLIHSLRLGYLRNVEDPYGPRLISFNPSFSTNPYINVASLADVNKWPELASPPSPPLSPDDESPEGSSQTRNNVPGPLGARGLKYTSTILGPSHTGALGMSVNGRRLVSKPTRPIVIAASQQDDDNNNNNAAPKPSPPPLKPIFIPKFKGAAEMDERRRLRIQVRRGVAAAAAAAATPEARLLTSPEKGATPELLSEDEEEEDSFSPEDDVDFDDDVVDVGVSVDLGDEFDP